MSSRASPVPSLTAVLSCAVENKYAGDLPQWFHVFLLRVAVSSKNTYTYTYTDTFSYAYTCDVECVCLHMGGCVVYVVCV